MLIHLVSTSRMYNILRDLLVLNDKVETAVCFFSFLCSKIQFIVLLVGCVVNGMLYIIS